MAMAAHDPSQPLTAIKNDWPFWLLRIAMKRHLEAAPKEGAAIHAQVRAMNTRGDLDQYFSKVRTIVASQKVEARKKRVAARRARMSARTATAERVSGAIP